MIKKFTLLMIVVTSLFISEAKAQPGVTPVYPYIQAFDSLAPFQFIEGQGGWLNGNFFGIDPSTVSVYPNRGIMSSQSMTMLLDDTYPTDSIITPMIGSLQANAFISYYYRIVDANGQALTLTGNGGFKIQMKQDIAIDWILVDSISVSNHTDSSEYVKKVITLPMDSMNVNFRFSFYQGDPGQVLYIDIDSLVINDSDLVVTNLHAYQNSNLIAIQNNEFNQISVKSLDENISNGAITIFDLNGKKTHDSTLKTYNIIDAGNWPKGIYFVQVSTTNKTFNQKIIVR
jgi:hypothetical protein